MWAIIIILWLLAGYGYFDLLRDESHYSQIPDNTRGWVLVVCLLLWPAAVIVRTLRRYGN